MGVKPERLGAVFRFALAVAAEADDWKRKDLGPIHLLKYAYLADLAHAKRHGGESFSGSTWVFHKFGPWSSESHSQIEPAMSALGASKKTFTSKFGDQEATRWSCPPESTSDERGQGLPVEVALAVARAVRQFGNDTNGLLHFVYRTEPMLKAAPGEELDLTPMPQERDVEGVGFVELERPVELSKTKMKRLRELAQKRLKERAQQSRLLPPDPPPRYDELWAEGLEQAASGLEDESGTLRFGESVWHSKFRHDPEVS